MKARIWQIDAFAPRVLAGNPAAVVPLERWLADDVLLAIAAENNLSETAFLVNEAGAWRIRWFTPLTEVKLCGHATLAAAHVLFTHLEPHAKDATFASLSGPLVVSRDGARIALDFPALACERIATPDALVAALAKTPRETWLGPKMMAVFDTEDDVVALAPDFAKVATLDGLGLIVTAPGKTSDIASRFFAPRVGVNEDPVTGSAHCQLVPYWSKRLGKTAIHARQVSKRGGELFCEHRGDRVMLSGEAVEYLSGVIEV